MEVQERLYQRLAPLAEAGTEATGGRDARVVLEVSDDDYRSVWRPCHALEEGSDGEPGE